MVGARGWGTEFNGGRMPLWDDGGFCGWTVVMIYNKVNDWGWRSWTVCWPIIPSPAGAPHPSPALQFCCWTYGPLSLQGPLFQKASLCLSSWSLPGTELTEEAPVNALDSGGEEMSSLKPSPHQGGAQSLACSGNTWTSALGWTLP
jgi:hypothetical protein